MNRPAKLSSLVFVRALCLLSALVIGPIIGATLMILITFVAPDWVGGAPDDVGAALGMWAFLIVGAMILGGPIALGAIVLMLPFLWRPRLSLPLVLAATALSTIAAGLVISDHRSVKDVVFSDGMAAFMALSLTSAAICWRLTKRWHSPA